ncbi:hypothetical protein SAMN05660860_01331 [Geoalkalibacter ferrihydriticus]|uniref:Uncharacterized protein n=2 Tax=Geoalkalibacter ferrihydriticus TaxID=392333 RepID=A0A0C2HSP6_9BACT|nr:hypothetical protein [Geoalkalibacter ferrihydriticus]KIH77820.1 hypothetical protein GFER_04065 [Geoalkalibacter ferrihydriticus DSM 17813]SDL80847.1 hypothetical protein SAMN05660860_01331 [Geoalkalibacter ferrihydriticus]
MSEYRLEKIEKDVVLFLVDGVVLEGVVFLSAFAYGHSGRQTLLELLREVERFLPFRDRAGTLRLINREAISHVRHVPQAQPESAPLGEEVGARLVFFGGETLEGNITLEMPEDKNRIKDFLNSAPAFFPLSSGNTHYIINSRQIHQVIPL